jgi:antirestriction protein ArdC
MSKDIYEIITDRILDQLEKGTIPWHKPWTGGLDRAYNYVSNKAYSVLNQMLLKHADAYLSFKQIQDLGGKIKKGAKSEIVTFWKIIPIKEKDKDGNEVTRRIPILRYYNVFWIGDTEGIERKEVERVAHDPVEEAENIINLYMNSENHPRLEREKTSNRAYYRPSTDTVVVPEIGQFHNVEEYYSVLFHELTHSTGAESRLNRIKAGQVHFGSESYSKEELVAEIGAATLTNIAGLETEKSFNNSADYIKGWSSALKENKRMIVEASSKAGKAVNYILGKKEEVLEG